MSRLLCLTAVLVSIICCSLLSLATAGKPNNTSVINSHEFKNTLDIRTARNTRETAKKKERKSRNRRRRNKLKKRKNTRKFKKSFQKSKELSGKKSLIAEKGKGKNKKKGGMTKNKKSGKTKRIKKNTDTKRRKGRIFSKTNENRAFVSIKDNCAELLHTSLRLSQEAAFKQYEASMSFMSKKSLKSSDFIAAYTLLSSACGNRAPPAILSTLLNCNIEILSKCKSPAFSTQEKTDINDCKKHKKTMDDIAKKLSKSPPAAMTWATECTAIKGVSNTATLVTDTNNCFANFQLAFSKVSSAKKNCRPAFLNCRQTERKVAQLIDSCTRNTPQTLIILNVINVVLVQINIIFTPIFIIIPGKRDRQKRQTGETANSMCLTFLEEWKTFRNSAEAAIMTLDSEVDVNATEQAIENLVTIMNRTDIEGDYKLCEKEFGVIFNQISPYFVWSKMWKEKVVEPKIELLTALHNNTSLCNTSSPSTASQATTETSTPTQTVTTVSPGRRTNFLMEIKKMKKI